MAYIFRRSKARGAPFYIAYRPVPGIRRIVRGCADRKATESLARKLETDAMLRRTGVIDSRIERFAQHDLVPLDDHVKAFEAALRGKGVTARHLAKTLSFIRSAIVGCAFTKLSDLDSAKVAEHVTDLRTQKNLHARAINARLTAIKSFTRWLFRTERIQSDPMMLVSKLNVKTDRRRVRRALTEEELDRLIAAAQTRRARRGMSGTDRAMAYRLAVETGLRRSEMASLTPASFDLAKLGNASVKVAAAYSKHRRDDTIPLRREMAEAIFTFLRDKPENKAVFKLPTATAEMFRKDLVVARNAWVEEGRSPEEREEREKTDFLKDMDSSGRVLDFHGLRHTFITRLAKSGTAPSVAKSLARHSTIVLTMDHYTHVLNEDERAALGRLPSTKPFASLAEDTKATGTDGKVAGGGRNASN